MFFFLEQRNTLTILKTKKEEDIWLLGTFLKFYILLHNKFIKLSSVSKLIKFFWGGIIVFPFVFFFVVIGWVKR
jgi:hypothetical protein